MLGYGRVHSLHFRNECSAKTRLLVLGSTVPRH